MMVTNHTKNSNADLTQSKPKLIISHNQNPLLGNINGHDKSDMAEKISTNSSSPFELMVPGTLSYPDTFADLGISHHSIIPMPEPSNEKNLMTCELVMDSHHVLTPGPGLVLLYNSLKLFKNPRSLVNRVLSLGHRANPDKILYLPGVASVNNLAILAYLGVDIYDNIQCIHQARLGNLMTSSGFVSYSNAQNDLCTCPGCIERLQLGNKNNDVSSDQFKSPSIELFGSLLKHNELALRSELAQIKTSMSLGNLRDLVEQRMVTEPRLSSVVRLMDLEFFSTLEPYFPVYRKGKYITTSREALNRVEVLRFRDRVLNRYQKPKDAKILILLPCSARKPYSTSKSHKLFFQAIQKATQGHENRDVIANLIHEVIVTSPLGLVPRELELVYPAQQYDIPVIGHWFEDELAMINDELMKYLNKNQYEHVIIHLSSQLSQSITENITSKLKNRIEILSTCDESPTKKSALDELSEQLHNLLLNYEKDQEPQEPQEPQERIDHRSISIEGIAGYQFDAAGYEFLKDTKVRGKYPYLKIFDSNTQLGMLTGDRGLISLTQAGAEQMYQITDFNYKVEIDDFLPKGSVMAVGVEKASQLIRSGDDVVIVFGDEVRGVGQAVMSGPEMVASNRGVAVKVRHHK
jgi:archaeosine synthase